MMAYYLKGRKLMAQNKMKEAAECFSKGQILPQNLGAGLWNIVKLVPYKYYEGICLKSLGQEAKAKENFEFITNIEIDYFSNMHLPELPYYQALCYQEIGERLKGDVLVNYTLQEWKEAIDKTDPGYFSTTPFFICFCDDAKRQRTAYYSYLLAKAYEYTGNEELKEKYIRKAVDDDPYSLPIFAADIFD
jgi:tetratricopeptide (TPR) repeat protein